MQRTVSETGGGLLPVLLHDRGLTQLELTRNWVVQDQDADQPREGGDTAVEDAPEAK